MHYFSIPSPIFLSVSGRDAPRYLDARLTNHIAGLKAGQGCLAAALTPQGKLDVLFAVFKNATENVLILADGGSRDEIVSSFKAFMVAERVAVEDLFNSPYIIHLSGSEPSELEGLLHTCNISAPPEFSEFSFSSQQEHTTAYRSRLASIGIDIICSSKKAGHLERVLAECGVEELSQSEACGTRLKVGRPSFPEDLKPGILMPALGIDSAVSFTKGCYIGQEVVEKLRSRGKTPLSSWQVKFPGKCGKLTGSDLFNTFGQRMGEVLNSGYYKAEDTTYCIALLKNRELAPKVKAICCGHEGELVKEMRT